MAVAVKNREATSAGMFDRLPVAIVAGVLYVLAGLGILFPLADWVWWQLLGLPADSAGAWLGLVAIDCAVGVGLVVLGKRLLGARPTKGLRAGIALGVTGIFFILLLTDWLGGQLADAFFERGWSKELGMGLTVAFGLSLLILGGRYFLSDKGTKLLAEVDEQGWFSTTSYKRSQGLRVRRGTILGVLILVFCGIWVLHQGLLKDGSAAAWQVGVPFTGKVKIDWGTVGDDKQLRERLGKEQWGYEDQVGLTEVWEQHRQEALKVLREAGYLPPDVRERLRDLAKDEADVKNLLKEREDNQRRAGGEEELTLDQRATLDQAVRALSETEKGAFLYVDRFWLRDKNKDFQANYAKVTDPGKDPYTNTDSTKGETFEPKGGEKYEVSTGRQFKAGEVVPKADLDEEVRLRQDKHDQFVEHKDHRVVDPNALVPPTAEAVVPAQTQPVEYEQRVLLPHVAYTLPAILAVLGLWFAWRLANVPTFGDFLIATEAELNKVSWTTRKRLWQDTIVVLVTVFLMAFALFIADVVWSRVLTAIGVLQPPPPSSERMQEQPW
jgi:preprotein translocase SecE subunit